MMGILTESINDDHINSFYRDMRLFITGLILALMLTGCAQKKPAVDTPVLQESAVEAGTTQNETATEVSDGEGEEKAAEISDKAQEKAAEDSSETPPEESKIPQEEKISADKAAVIDEQYRKILYEYVEAEEGGYSRKQLKEMGLITGLSECGWPAESVDDEVGFVYYDVDSNGTDELIITWKDQVMDIYGFDGENVRLAFSTSEPDSMMLYPGGMLRMDYSEDELNSDMIWYQYDAELGDYLPVFQRLSAGDAGDEYYVFCAYDLSEEEREEVTRCYRETGYYPVWLCEWLDMMTADEYEAVIPDKEPVVLPESEKLSALVLPDDYIPAYVPPVLRGGDGEPVEIDADTQKKLNLFLSNFSEQEMTYYDAEKPSLRGIARFAFFWSSINRISDVEYIDPYFLVSFDTIQGLAKRYFGLELKEEQLDDMAVWSGYNGEFFSNGYYHIRTGDGEIRPIFTVVESAEDVGKDDLRLVFTVYHLDTDTYMDHNYSVPSKYYALTGPMAEELTRERGGFTELTRAYSGYAIVHNEGDRYMLKYYEPDWDY